MYARHHAVMLSVLSIVVSAASQNCDAYSPSASTTDPQAFAAITYDYLIVGGGTAGLVLASRLSENQNVQVGVIEAGIFHQGDPLIDIPAYSGRASGNPLYDWSFVTVPQPGANGQSITMPRGKMIGGSTGLNSMAWTRASKPEYDVWESFAQDSGWGWEGILPYLRKTSAVYPNQTTTVPEVTPAAYDPLDEGFVGPVSTSFNTWYSDPFFTYLDTVNAVGIETNANPDNGTTTGIWNTRSNVDRATGTRSYAAPAYYCNTESRENLHVLMEAQATKVLLTSTREGISDQFKATGVELSFNSSTFVVNTTGEVILSAGVYQSPQLLELSGIGNKTLLEGLGINTLLDLPEVGENLQDHLFSFTQYQLNPGLVTFDDLTNNATFAAEQEALYNETHAGVLAATNSALAFLPLSLFLNETQIQSLLSTFDEVVAQSNPSPLQAMQYAIQREWLEQGAVPQVELIMWSEGIVSTTPNETYITVFAGGLHHLNRGSVHINSSVGLARPVIDPQWLNNDFDVKLILEGLKLVQSLGAVEPLSTIVGAVTSPPSNVQNDTALINYVRETVQSGQHPMGTAAMGPQALGGVVDGRLKVYGTENLRICDASIVPISIGAHLQSTIFAMAEKLADTIKASEI